MPDSEPDAQRYVVRLPLISAAAILTILYVAGTLSIGAPPTATDSGAEVVEWFRQHREGVQWFVWATTISAPLSAFVYTMLRRTLPAPHGDMFFIGAVSIVVTQAVQAWIWGGLSLHAEQLEPATARTMLDVALFWGPVLTGATITMMAPVTLLALRRRAGLPRWLGVIGLVAVTEQAIETMTIFGATGFTEPGGAMNMQLGAALVMLWMLGFAAWASYRGQPH